MTKLEQQVWDKLREVPDPELNIPLVDLGLIYKVKVNKNSVHIVMTLTTIGCPLFAVIDQQIKDKVLEIPSIKKVTTKLVFDPPWGMEMMTDEAKVELGII